VRHDSTRNVAVAVGREGAGARRWQKLDNLWEEPMRRMEGRLVPQKAESVSIRPHFPSTRDFFSDSVCSPTRKTRTTGHTRAIKGGPEQRWGSERQGVTELKRYGEWVHWKDQADRPSTAGVRAIAWNYHWDRH